MTKDRRIPMALHFIWFGKPMPDHLAANVEEWKRLHPRWRCYLWTEKNLPLLRNASLFQRAEKLVPADAVEQFRADIVRYELLYDMGGFYADADTRPLRPIDTALGAHQAFAAMEDRNWVGNTYLGAVPGHPIFRDLIAGLPANVQRLRGKRPNHLSGPRYLTPVWRRHSGYTAPSRLFFPYSYTHVKADNVPTDFADDVVAVHGWNHTRTVLERRRVGA